MSAKDEIKKVVKEGIRQGQAEVGAPLPPLTKLQWSHVLLDVETE